MLTRQPCEDSTWPCTRLCTEGPPEPDAATGKPGRGLGTTPARPSATSSLRDLKKMCTCCRRPGLQRLVTQPSWQAPQKDLGR